MAHIPESAVGPALTAAGSVAVVVLGGIGWLGRKVWQLLAHARRADWQVSNNHVDGDGNPINMREELDERHAELLEAVAQVAGSVRGVQRDLGRLDSRVIALTGTVTLDSGRIRDLEDREHERELHDARKEHNRVHRN
ncbi:hypothetical protein [Curtobacterium phage Penoan]|nr:hypothetical protein [Curtobacterium phage Penoan]